MRGWGPEGLRDCAGERLDRPRDATRRARRNGSAARARAPRLRARSASGRPPGPAWRPGSRKSGAITTSPEARRRERVGEERPVEVKSGSVGRLHRRGRQAACRCLRSSARTASATRLRISAEAREGPPWSTTTTAGRSRPRAGGRLADAVGDDRRRARRQSARPSAKENSKPPVSCWSAAEVAAERGADRALRADEEGDEEELALAGGHAGRGPTARASTPAPPARAPAGSGRCASTRRPRRGTPAFAADRRRRGPQALVGRGLEGAVVDQGDLHRAARSCRADSNQASLSENAATSPMMSIAGRLDVCLARRGRRSFPGVPRIRRCSPVVADWTIAAGVGGRQAAGLEAARDGRRGS